MRGRVDDDPATALREHLIDTAEKLLGERQVSTITTRDIARAAGVSDGVLYNYFAGKHELLIAALVRRHAGSLTQFETDLPAPGTGSVENFRIDDTLPTAAGLLSEPALLQGYIEGIHQQPYGPQRMHRPIADYLAGEQRLGRLGAFDVEPAVHLIIGPALMLGFSAVVAGVSREALAEQIPGIVRTLLTGLQA